MANKLLSGITTFLLIAIPLFAHHGTAASYDASKSITLTGTVTEFVFGNPHAQLYFDVKDSSGKVVHWGGELFCIPSEEQEFNRRMRNPAGGLTGKD